MEERLGQLSYWIRKLVQGVAVSGEFNRTVVKRALQKNLCKLA